MSAFPYIGGKSQYAPWIIDHMPQHRNYVEPFGGAGSVLLNKPESRTEVYNDRHEDLVHFFRVAREQPDELYAWLRRVPYARDVHERWTKQYYNGERPDEDIERAGRFYFTRFSQFAAKIASRSGFKAAKNSNPASAFNSGRERIAAVADRFANVIIENRDWSWVANQYDDSDTLAYFDPPYIGREGYYGAMDFDHEEFVSTLHQLESDWMVSYEDPPEELRTEDVWVVEKDTQWSARANNYGGYKDATECLVMNFNPEERTPFSGDGQQKLGEVA